MSLMSRLLLQPMGIGYPVLDRAGPGAQFWATRRSPTSHSRVLQIASRVENRGGSFGWLEEFDVHGNLD
jgi:hypothetical protein